MSKRGGGITAKVSEASLRRVEQKLAQKQAELEAAAKLAVTITAEATALVETRLVPVDTGALMRGIKVRYSRGGLAARVGIFDQDLYYAVLVEWGTTIRPAVPFATPAAERARVEFERNVRAQIAKKAG